MFKYLDRGEKGFISYPDFCELCEEKRRHLDPFDTKDQFFKRKTAEDSKTWVQNYLYDANLTDLELMSKRAQLKNVT